MRYGLGSEGSFGPDPYLGVTPWGMEVMAWWDQSAARSIHAMVQGPQTNYAQCLATDLNAGLNFASQSGYPSHGLILGRPFEPWFNKEIRDLSSLEQALVDGLRHGPVWLETDMRAHRNPTRMAMISRAADALALRLKSLCPHCRASGFGPVALVEGARCEDCGSVTRAARARTLQCGACGHTCEEAIRATVPAAQCPACNP